MNLYKLQHVFVMSFPLKLIVLFVTELFGRHRNRLKSLASAQPELVEKDWLDGWIIVWQIQTSMYQHYFNNTVLVATRIYEQFLVGIFSRSLWVTQSPQGDPCGDAIGSISTADSIVQRDGGSGPWMSDKGAVDLNFSKDLLNYRALFSRDPYN